MTLKTYYEDGDVYYGDSINWVNGIIANSTDYTYNVDGTVATITQTVSGSTITTTFTYTDGILTSISESRDGKTITTTFTYDSGNLTNVTRTVA